jgi:hypothetical protein
MRPAAPTARRHSHERETRRARLRCPRDWTDDLASARRRGPGWRRPNGRGAAGGRERASSAGAGAACFDGPGVNNSGSTARPSRSPAVGRQSQRAARRWVKVIEAGRRCARTGRDTPPETDFFSMYTCSELSRVGAFLRRGAIDDRVASPERSCPVERESDARGIAFPGGRPCAFHPTAKQTGGG